MKASHRQQNSAPQSMILCSASSSPENGSLHQMPRYWESSLDFCSFMFSGISLVIGDVIAFMLSSLRRPHGLTWEPRVEVACWHPKRDNTLHQFDWTDRNPDVPVLLASHPWFHQHRRELFRWAIPSSPDLCPIRLQQSLSCLKTLIPDIETGYSSTHLNGISTNLCRSWLQRILMGGLYIHETSTPVLESLVPREGQQL